jgi:hypothetical protein
MRWRNHTKTCLQPDGRRVKKVAGKECYHCWDVRRRDHVGLSMEELKKQRERDETIDRDFQTIRRARARGKDKWVHRATLEMKGAIVNAEEAYKDSYRMVIMEGSFKIIALM